MAPPLTIDDFPTKDERAQSPTVLEVAAALLLERTEHSAEVFLPFTEQGNAESFAADITQVSRLTDSTFKQVPNFTPPDND